MSTNPNDNPMDRALRRAVADAHRGGPAIPFARVLAGARARREQPASRWRPRLALAAAIAVIAFAVAAVPPAAPPPTPIAWSGPTDFLLGTSSIQSPTDFLLQPAPAQGDTP